MRNLLSLAAVAVIAVAGCNKTPPGGTTPTNPSNPTPAGSDTTFNLSLPSATIPTSIKQGTSEVVKVTVDRGSNFKQGVKLKIETPEKVKAEYKDMVAASDPEEVAVTLAVDKGAAVGEHTIKVTGTPDGGGSATSGEFKIKVTTP